MKNKVTFMLPEKEGFEHILDVPISIRNASLEFVQHTLLNQEVSLTEGHYIASATLPHGDELQRVFEIKDESGPIHLALKVLGRPALAASALSFDEPQVLSRSKNIVPVGSQDYAKARAPRFPLNANPEAARAASIELLSGNALSADGMSAADTRPQLSDDGSMVLHGMPEPPYSVLIRVADHAPVLVALPISERESAIVEFLTSPEGPVVNIRPSNDRTALQLDYLAAHMFDEASQIVKIDAPLNREALADDAVEMLRAKVDAPIGAAIGGYVLLMRGELEDLANWVRNLATWFEWLPDGAVLYAELLARHGRHAEAIHWFMALGERGLPIVAAGLRISLKRMTEYARFLDQDRFVDVDREMFDELFQRLASVSTSLVDSQSLLTFNGVPDELSVSFDGEAPRLEAQ